MLEVIVQVGVANGDHHGNSYNLSTFIWDQAIVVLCCMEHSSVHYHHIWKLFTHTLTEMCTHTHTHTHMQMLLMSPPLSVPPTSSPVVLPSPSPVTMTVFHLPLSPGSTMASLSLQQTLVSPSPPQTLAQTSCAPTWGRMREGDTPAMPPMWLAVTALTSMLSYKVCVHVCSIPGMCVQFPVVCMCA